MEAAFQRKDKSAEVSIPNVGRFRIDIDRMVQVSLTGRNPGYERPVRRQARRIAVGYFILGEEDDMYISDSAVDQIEDQAVLETLACLLQRMIADPESLGFFSLNLQDDEFRDTLGQCDESVDFLEEHGFQTMEESGATFLVFIQEGADVTGLCDALKEVQARQGRLARNQQPASVPAATSLLESGATDSIAADSNVNAVETTPAEPSAAESSVVESNVVESNAVEPNAVESNVVESGAVESNVVRSGGAEPSVVESDAVESNAVESNAVGSNAVEPHVAEPPPDEVELLARAASEARADAAGGRHRGAGTGRAGKGRGKAKQKPAGQRPDGQSRSREAAEAGTEGYLLVLPSGERVAADLEEDTLECLLRSARKRSGLRLPAVQVSPPGGRPLPVGLAAAPGATLRQAAQLQPGDRLAVSDFEPVFVSRLQGGILRVQDLACVAPLLDWGRPELLKLLTNRLRALLEGPCASWCEAAGCEPEDELACGLALLRRLYGSQPVEARVEAFRRLLPEARGTKAVLKVDRAKLIESAVTGLRRFSRQELRGAFSVEFLGETAEDHGGPRRDFFGHFGTQLCAELPVFWRRTPLNMMVPTTDMAAELSPKDVPDLEDVPSVYRSCGRACGLALKHGDVIGDEFAEFFVHQVVRDKCVTLRELQRQLAESSGPDFRANSGLLKQTLSQSGLEGLTLSRELSGTQPPRTVELVPGGSTTPVTEDNKKLWLELHLKNKLYDALQKAADAFREGLLDIVGGSRATCPLFALLAPAEIVRLWAGRDVGPEGLRRWRAVAVVSGEVREQADWLWELLEEADDQFRGRVLEFSTGARRLSQEGLQRFEVQPYDGGDEQLPHAMTCGNMLQLPRYSSKDVLRRQLAQVLTELGQGFGVV